MQGVAQFGPGTQHLGFQGAQGPAEHGGRLGMAQVAGEAEQQRVALAGLECRHGTVQVQAQGGAWGEVADGQFRRLAVQRRR